MGKQKDKSFPVVGIGGSAGSFSSFEKFFTHMPADSGMSFVIIMHLDPHYKSQLTEVMQRYTAMPVIEATDGIAIEQNKVYLLPPNKDMGIHNRKLLLLAPSKPTGIRQPIDYFLQSLAEDQWNRSVAIIFSGMGSDGETGIRMIKEKLGLTMVQDPETAEYDSMPLAAVGTNLVDFVLSPEEMPQKLIRYMSHPVLAEEASDQVKSSIENANAIQKILMLLRSHTGNDFASYKKNTITRRIDRRIAYYQLPDYGHYVDYLQENPQEIDTLFNELLIGVTKFFRDSAAFDSLKNKLSHVIQAKTKKESVRVWVAGCSTGEEAYSVAMLLIECLDTYKSKDKSRIQIYATDLDADALDIARAGVYHSNIAADVSPERIERFFVKKEEQYSVKKELREMIVFAQQNLIKDAPFIRLDLLCCRNMLIYFTTELQRKIIPLFYYALNTNGIMFMGPAETIGGFTDMFAAIDPKWKLFERKKGNIQMNKIIDFPFHVAKQPMNITKIEDPRSTASEKSVVAIFNKVLIDKFTPASVLVNEKGDILYSNGKSGKYLELPSGEAVVNIHKMAREELKYVIGNSIHQAIAQEGTVITEAVKLKEDKHVRMVSLKASALREPGMEELVLLVFEDQGLLGKKPRTGVITKDNSNAKELEKELVYTKQRLNNTIEQMETSLEELKSTNEELQSTNEELQSTNEESLTTKEEMQSLNEELMTINMQYQAKAEELTRLNNDMKNLLDATEIGTMFLDNNLDILRYTPQVRKLFNLIPTDVGRPIVHVVSNFETPFDENDIKEVIDKLTIKEIDVKTKHNEWYRIRIMPYRTLDNFISGAVLTFTLVTDYKQMQSRLQVLQDYSASLMNTIGEAVIQLDIELSVLAVNTRFLEIFQIAEKDVFGKSLGGFLKERWKTEIPDQLLNKCLRTRVTQSALINIGEKEPRTFELTAKPFAEETNTTPLIVVMINEQKESRK
ncbi:CheR family methyltransferase [Mucilaginibacter lappiensis]|uniref:protein-glutamate O-methyltransferase n=1 Tax=Mucilaginibacter lappiensis TaxID=354630 RepID=A0A841JC88_9SPHI|nr:CheR family methyltransferase [Mucilaginibacter lappiensis]MBB6107595.1 two-component system CheB/CheR fusion protein [Mucilaginibacter lappiensis]MBB6126085.1 two-component system CheB/CheR fusion protein [Mucilaginibacter lappiensis]